MVKKVIICFRHSYEHEFGLYLDELLSSKGKHSCFLHYYQNLYYHEDDYDSLTVDLKLRQPHVLHF